MKFLIIICFVLTLFFNENFTFDAESYTTYIEELSDDEKFLQEYTKWSLELFSQPDYLYGTLNQQFPCSIEKSNDNYMIPTSVHTLRPSDVTCIAAIGDSLTTGLAAHAITPMDLLVENRGISWSIGGDYTYTKFVTIPNILREYNSKLQGFSTKVSVMSRNDRDINNHRLNFAKSNHYSRHMPYQAELLINRIKNEKLCNWNDDWKVITIFTGTNDLCNFCEDTNVTKYTPEQYMYNVRNTLDKLYEAPMPRTLVNLVLALDIRGAKKLYTSGYVCQILHKKICPCAAFPTIEQDKILDDYISRYHQVLVELINTGRYDERDDFTVVIQPFMAKAKLPYRTNHNIDFSYFAPDCYHFSGKGHSQVALSLWNNMFEPVGGKQWSWHMDNSLKCPTKEYPYIFTLKNSIKALNELKNATVMQTTNPMTTIISRTSDIITTSEYHHKHRKSNSKSSFNKMKVIAIIAFLSILMIILIWGLIKRRKAQIFNPENAQHHFSRVSNSQYPDDDGDVEIWNRFNTETTKTHGTRISLD